MKMYCAIKLNQELTSKVQLLVQTYGNTPPLTPTPLDRVHLTTLFLGDTTEEIGRQVLRSAAHMSPFKVHLMGPGSFDDRVLYLGVQSDYLCKLNNLQRFSAEKHGLKPAVRYEPHITLCKMEKKGRARGQILNLIDKIVNEVQDWNHLGWSMVESLGLYSKSELLDEVLLGQ